MKYLRSHDIRIFKSKASNLTNIIRILFTSGIILFSLNGLCDCQFGQFEDYFPEQIQQYQDFIDEDIPGLEDFQDITEIQDGFNPLDQYDNSQACHNSDGEQACIASAGTVRVGKFGRCYCDLPDGRSCDFQYLIAGHCGEESSPGPEPDSECSGTLQGRVADASTGLPISGAVIVPEVASNGGTLTSTTDDSGCYSISRPEISLCPKKVSFYVKCSADGYQPASNMASTDANGDATCDFQLVPLSSTKPDSECTGTLQGRVVDASTGLPVSRAVIDANCKTVCPTTNELGYYSITSPEVSICPGTSRKVDCSADGYQPATNYAPTDSEGDITCDFQLVPLSSPEPEPEPEIYSFTVNVVDAQNNAVEGAEVTVDDWTRGVTGPDGRLTVQLADGDHDANASKDDMGTGYWSGTLNHELNREFAITIPETSSPEPKEPTIRIVSIDPVEGTVLNAGDSVEFTFTVEYDLGDYERGKIKVAVDRFTMGHTDDERAIPDDTRDISTGDSHTGSYTFTLTDNIGLDWSNAYVFADLYASKNDIPIPATVSAFDYKEYPLKAEAASSPEIRFEGTAIEPKLPSAIIGGATSWAVTVDKLISGPQPCITPIDVITYQSTGPIWGSVDKSIEAGDKVEVYGSYITDDKGCRVTLHGSESFYFKKAACSGVVRGHVLDAQTDQPIVGASLECSLYCNGSVTTDVQGYYELGSPACNICGLVYCSVTCSADGYEQQVQSLVTDVDGNGEKDLDFYLQPKKISRVVIQGEVTDRPANIEGKYQVSVLIKKVIQKPIDTMLVSPGKTIVVKDGIKKGSLFDLIKGNCYEFNGSWMDEALWIRHGDPNPLPIDCPDDKEEQEILGCGKILYYDISKGRHFKGDTIRGNMKYKSNVDGEADFSGTLLLKSPSGQVYSGLMNQVTTGRKEDSFGYEKSNPITFMLPSDAALGLYDAKLELRRHDTGELCDETKWFEDQLEVESKDKAPFEEVKFIGTVLTCPDKKTGELHYKIAISNMISGPQLKDQVDVIAFSILEEGPWGDVVGTDILVTNVVEVFGRICGTYSRNPNCVTLNGREEYYLKKLSGIGCDGEISGHVFDAETNLPISDAQVWSDKRRHDGGLSKDDGYYRLLRACPNMNQMLHCQAEGYETERAEVTTDNYGNAAADFYLKPKPPGRCVQKDCEARNQFMGEIKLKDGKFYMEYYSCKCKGDECECSIVERELIGVIRGKVYDANTNMPISDAKVCIMGDICKGCAFTDSMGNYLLSIGQAQGGCSFKPETTYSLRASAGCYKEAVRSETTDKYGNKFGVDFQLPPRPKCKQSDCDKFEKPIGDEYTDNCGDVLQDYDAWECQGCECVNIGKESRKVVPGTKVNHPPWDPEILSLKSVSSKKWAPITIRFKSDDQDHQKIKYYINWDDGTGIRETEFYNPGVEVSSSHAYMRDGNFEVTVKAEDECGMKSSGHLCIIYVTVVG